MPQNDWIPNDFSQREKANKLALNIDPCKEKAAHDSAGLCTP